jgi:hypothetical protein
MAKAKSKAVLSVNELERRVAAQLLLAQNRFVALENQTKALEEAICPQVAARLMALERVIQRIPFESSVYRSPPRDESKTYGSGECSAPRSKANDRGIVSYMITRIKRETGLEFTEQGMKRIITLIEKV